MNIYILCPANRVTGGIELAHQLCSAINNLTDEHAFMLYINIDTDSPEELFTNFPTPKEYLMYGTRSINPLNDFESIDTTENAVVIPEGITDFEELFENAKKIVWWMSVDNYVHYNNKEKIEELSKNIDLHLYQSNYAKEYINKMIPDVRGLFLSDYINEQHGQFIFPPEYRRNTAFFNPKKGYDKLKPLIEKANWLQWIPLQDMSREKMILMMQYGKIYVDFGKHPGKDRIPREAAANGCCVITNKEGSAAYHEDVPIDDEYKFANPTESLDDINNLMHDICDNFEVHQKRFEDYRRIIKNEKREFDKSVIKFVELLKTI